MYYVSLAARNYNLQIRPLALAGAQLAVFRTVLESCTGPRISSSCDIEMGYYWATAGAGDGYGQITIFSGSGEASTTPAPGNALTSLVILNITASCAGFNAVEACTSNVDTTTTTTTTTTSTTTTTTTVTTSDPGAPAIKFDQYSGSYNSSTGVWANIGSSGSAYNLVKNPYNSSVTITAGGSGTAAYLDLTGALSGPVNDQGYYTPLVGSFISLYNISFSYSIVFQFRDNAAGYFSVDYGGLPNGFSLTTDAVYNFDGTIINRYLLKTSYYGRVWSNASTAFPNLVSNKWYLLTMVFDKSWSTGNQIVAYLNNTNTLTLYMQNSSTFFEQTNAEFIYGHFLGLNPATTRIAAIMFWQNKILTANERQALYNEYNTRYTLG